MQPHRVGSHLVTRQAPDLLCIRVVGSLTHQEVRELVQADRALRRERGYSRVLIDLSGAASFDAAVRRASLDEAKRYFGFLGSTAAFGVSGATGVRPPLIAHALRLLGVQEDELRSFESESAARTFLSTCRPARQQQVQAQSQR